MRYVFVTPMYQRRWSSIKFYARMMERIRATLLARGHQADVVGSIAGLSDPSATLVLDPAAIISLAREGELGALETCRYALIIGENIDSATNSFVGWGSVPYLRDLTLEPGGRLRQIVGTAWRATWQNERVRDLLAQTKNPSEIMFFPIDAYEPSHVLDAAGTIPDIDVLIYGGMGHPRRARFAAELFTVASDRTIVICSNLFELDALLLRAKTLIHVNSVGGCDHVPYAKIIKPLANNKVIFVESTAELESSDLRQFVRTFVIDDIPALVEQIGAVLARFDEEQRTLGRLRPAQFLSERYNFANNVVSLLAA